MPCVCEVDGVANDEKINPQNVVLFSVTGVMCYCLVRELSSP